jgi:hypothetical protein
VWLRISESSKENEERSMTSFDTSARFSQLGRGFYV